MLAPYFFLDPAVAPPTFFTLESPLAASCVHLLEGNCLCQLSLSHNFNNAFQALVDSVIRFFRGGSTISAFNCYQALEV